MMFDPRTGEVIDFFRRARGLGKPRAAAHQRGVRRGPAARATRDAVRRAVQPARRAGDRRALPTDQIHLRRTRHRTRARGVFKWAEKSTTPSAGLRFLAETEWIEHFPEVNALRGTPQDSEWHPEGDVFTHTCHCGDALVKLPAWQKADAETKIVLALAVLAHDFAKPQTTRAQSRMAASASSRLATRRRAGVAESFLTRINARGPSASASSRW